MTLGSFLQFVEIQTKLASIIPLAMGTVYALYRYESFRPENFIIMFISLLTFDMATTAINNYLDYKKAQQTEGYNYRIKNALVRDGIRESTALAVIFTLLTIATVFGLILTFKTDLVVLLIGVISFLVGIFYTFGPVPISRMPLGELFSGVFMGFVIIFLAIYIHVFDRNIVSLVFEHQMLNISIDTVEVFYIFLISIPAIGGIANIMLANNICDVEEDIINKRYTLPYYLGREKALQLFKTIYYLCYIDIILIVALKLVPPAALLVLLTLIPVNKNIKRFYQKPVKSETFVLAVKNFALMKTTEIILVAITLIANKL